MLHVFCMCNLSNQTFSWSQVCRKYLFEMIFGFMQYKSMSYIYIIFPINREDPPPIAYYVMYGQPLTKFHGFFLGENAHPSLFRLYHGMAQV